ncbi:MAG: aminotransferase class I/II-fold pyridoxal phosphate-dependent enzyme [Candidatus Hydrogenedentes bacterium]|nr:aminotransferase class I/II-fold pyridoxal phosphate-dependent enzyme [Candidatus Hydrogenedentota bacterium]
MRIVVTGGAGYLGCKLVPLLLDEGHDVVLFDRFCFGEEPIRAFADHPKCTVVRGDLRQLAKSPHLLDGAEAIAHLAGLANDPSCDLDPETTLNVNVDATRRLAEMALGAGVGRFVFASSCSVYGDSALEVVDEQSPVNPVSAYAESKVEAENLLLGMKSDRFEPVITRAATLFGTSPRMRFDLAINQMTATATRNRVINVLGGGKQWRPFIHVADAARAWSALLQAPAAQVSGEIFNLGDDKQNISIADLARQVEPHFSDVTVDVASDDADRRSYRVRFGKLAEVLRFACSVSIDDGIEEVQEYLKDESIDPFDEQYFNLLRMKHLLETPVEQGGEPVAPRFIPMARPELDEHEEQAVVDTLRSGWITSGPHVPAFEAALRERTGAPHIVAVSSCTAALHLCLVHLGIQPGDEVITTPLTWASVGNILLTMGARPVFADIEPGTLNIDPASIAAAITEKTRAIIPVHMTGQPCDLDAIRDVATKHGIPLIEDAAHALGAAYHGTPIGQYSDFTCFSFYAIKNVTTMEGGAIAVQDKTVAKHLRLLAESGMTATAWDRYGEGAAPAPPEVVEPGYKYLMNNVGAAIGLEQLKKFDRFQEARERLSELYRTALSEIDEIRLLDETSDVVHARHLMIIRLRLDRLTASRDEIAQALRLENVGTGVHFYGLHLHQYYRETLGMKPEDLPEATAASKDVLSLPLFPGMTDKDARNVVAALKKVLVNARRAD